jgi:CubicO group peptidase (beta-lactamase class C family)
MKSTTFEPVGDLKSRTAIGYQYEVYEDAPVVAGFPSIAGLTAAGQVYSTVEDLAWWVSFHAGSGADSELEHHSSVLSVRSRKEM